MLDAFAKDGFDVFAGSEAFLLDNMRHGGKGCITATGNVNPGPIANLYKNWRSADADRLQTALTATRKIVQKQPMIPALKATVAHFGNDPQWKTCRPPLIELTAAQEEELIRDLKAAGFSMPGLAS
jgi:4-hydroxy-tetrahydrodipicolinate synthase